MQHTAVTLSGLENTNWPLSRLNGSEIESAPASNGTASMAIGILGIMNPRLTTIIHNQVK